MRLGRELQTTRLSMPTCSKLSATISTRIRFWKAWKPCWMSDPAQRDHVCQKLDQYVVKAVGESGGYGMLIGPHSMEPESAEFREKILAQPRNYIAQPTINLSTAPCFVGGT